MTHRERQLAAIRHELTDRLSVDAISVEIVDQIAEHLGAEPGQVHERLGIDGRIVGAPYAGPPLEATDEGSLTQWGTVNTGDYGTAHTSPLSAAETVAEVEDYNWPDATEYDYEAAAESAARMAETHATRGPYWHPLFCRVCDLFGMEAAMVHLASEPALFEAALEQVFEHVFEYCRRLLAACGDALDIFCLGDDFATQRGLMISPQDWRQYVKPRLGRLFEMAKGHGKYVWFHSCGDITAVLPDLIDIGMDVWETVQLHTLPMAPEELKREFGSHLTFFGAVSTQALPFSTPGEVSEEVERCIRVLGRDGGYICGPDHHIKPDVSPELAVALFDAATSFRSPGYTLRA